MTDMLVRLYDLPECPASPGVDLRRPHPWEKDLVLDWVARHFSKAWAREAAVAFSRVPVSAWVAVADGGLAGFACHDCTARNFFGPMGVAERFRGKGMGRALLLRTLWCMRDDGYAYAVIGGVGPVGFYEKIAGAVVIVGSTPGIYGSALADDVVSSGNGEPRKAKGGT
jgi:GNAT superfamily N-acetyltransferase